jgi:hypothetical protein
MVRTADALEIDGRVLFISQLKSLHCHLFGSDINHFEANTKSRRLAPAGLDIVFLMDESGSMTSEQTALRDNVATLFTALVALNPVTASKVGLVGFGEGTSGGIFAGPPQPSEAHVHTPLTAIQGEFAAAANDLTLTGAMEPSCESICKTIEGDLEEKLGFRQGPFGIVLISDEPSNFDNPEYNMDRVISSMKNVPPNDANAQGFFYGIVPMGEAMDSYQPVATATGGAMYDVAAFKDNPANVLKDIITKLNVAVNPPTPAANIHVEPDRASVQAGNKHQLTASLSGMSGGDVGKTLGLEVLYGPHQGFTASALTNAAGIATLVIPSSVGESGRDIYEVCLQVGGSECGNLVSAKFEITVAPSQVPGGPTPECINCNSPGTSTPFTIPTTLTATATGSCGPLILNVTGEDCYRVGDNGIRKYKSSTCVASLSGPSITIGTTCKDGDHVEWPVVAVDTLGRAATKICYVIFSGTRRLPQSHLRRFS